MNFLDPKLPSILKASIFSAFISLLIGSGILVSCAKKEDKEVAVAAIEVPVIAVQSLDIPISTESSEQTNGSDEASERATGEVLKNAIIIPKKAIIDLQGLKQVLLVRPDNTIELRTVTIKNEVDDLVLIDSGLAAGERFVPEVQQRLTAGMTIKPIEQK